MDVKKIIRKSSRQLIILQLLCTATTAQLMVGESRDVVEGESLRLPCRFHSAFATSTTQYFWSRVNRNGKDNAAINAASLDSHYSIDFSPQEGKYDLVISRSNYDKDNGKFECWLKEGGSGVDIYSVSYVVTVLIPPGEPRITPPNPIAREGEPAALTCSSEGGSPDPQIRWYRDGVLLQAQLQKGGSRERPTSSVLTVTPRLEDDDTMYRCVVWNRAMKEDQKLEASVNLRVHFSPRITVGPSNPLNVLEDSDAHFSCSVIASPPVRTIRWMKNGHLLSNTPNHSIPSVRKDDSGTYSCVADNGVGDPVQANLELAVLYGPEVKLIPDKEISAGDSLVVKCNVDSKPSPHMIQWLKEGDPYFRQTGDTLRIEKVSVDDGGRYICQAITAFRPSGSNVQTESIGNSSISIRVRHKPGQAEILPVQPIAIAGRPFTLSCTASPLGWPTPSYRWWKEGHQKVELSHRANYTMLSMHMSQEGRYFCQPYNALGQGGSASVYLTVHEPATITIPLRPQVIKKDKDKEFSITCRAKGKPRPRVRWLQNGQEISEDSGLFKASTSEILEDNNAFTVQSTLSFAGPGRRDHSLTPGDRGRYTCEFENGVGESARSEMVLRIEHSPVVRHTYNRVAFDVGETAVLQCKMQAYPSPTFEWFTKSRILDEYGNYGTNITDLGEDIYAGVLSIRDVKEEDYGDYTCKASNQVGDDKKTIIRLVKKGPPEEPTNLELIEVSSDKITLRWQEGFNGGFVNTEFLVTYTNLHMGQQMNESCRSQNLCQIIGLSANTEYHFKVLALNPRGYSPYSEEISVTTKVNLKDMPRPSKAQFDKDTGYITFHVELSALKLLGKIEARTPRMEAWILQKVVKVRRPIEKIQIRPPEEGFTFVRVRLCLESNDSWCGDPRLANTVDEALPNNKESRTAILTEHLIIIVAIAGAVFLSLMVLVICCCWKRRTTPKEKKDYEMESTNPRPKAVTPPYYPDGVVNKGLDGTVDDISKPGIYTTNTSAINGHIPTAGHPSAGMIFTPEIQPSPGSALDHSEPWLKASEDMTGEGSYQPYDSRLPNGYYIDDYPLTEEMMNMKNQEHLREYSPYYDVNVSGVPDRYALAGDEEKTQNVSLSFDETLESGYSTPNSRSRRVIREIIV